VRGLEMNEVAICALLGRDTLKNRYLRRGGRGYDGQEGGSPARVPRTLNRGVLTRTEKRLPLCFGSDETCSEKEGVEERGGESEVNAGPHNVGESSEKNGAMVNVTRATCIEVTHGGKGWTARGPKGGNRGAGSYAIIPRGLLSRARC